MVAEHLLPKTQQKNQERALAKKGAQPKKTGNRPESPTEQQEKRRRESAQGITEGRQAEPESSESDQSFGKLIGNQDQEN